MRGNNLDRSTGPSFYLSDSSQLTSPQSSPSSNSPYPFNLNPESCPIASEDTMVPLAARSNSTPNSALLQMEESYQSAPVTPQHLSASDGFRSAALESINPNENPIKHSLTSPNVLVKSSSSALQLHDNDFGVTSTDEDALEDGYIQSGKHDGCSEGEKNAPLATRVRRRLQSTRRRHQYRRLVFKNGECNISHANIKKRKRRYLADIFTTLVDFKWRYTLLLFILAFICSWFGFAIIWYLISFAHSDIMHKDDMKWLPCMINVIDFTTALLFSVETQHTIGYGSRHITSECPEAILLMMVQCCFGVIIQALMTGLVFAKLSRPKKRAETLMFSKNAVICKRDGVMTLLFRVGDMRKSHIIEAHVRGAVIKKRVTSEGEVLPMEQYDVNVGYDEGKDRLFLVWPVIIEHKIDENSPFWEFSSVDMQREQFEFIVILEGIVESTGMTTQARSSYLPNEILWGHRFEKLITYQKDNGEYQLDYEKFHCVKRITNFPQCSAKELSDLGEENLSAKGLIHDDDVSLASKSIANNSSFIKRNGSMYGGAPLKRSALNIANSTAMIPAMLEPPQGPGSFRGWSETTDTPQPMSPEGMYTLMTPNPPSSSSPDRMFHLGEAGGGTLKSRGSGEGQREEEVRRRSDWTGGSFKKVCRDPFDECRSQVGNYS